MSLLFEQEDELQVQNREIILKEFTPIIKKGLQNTPLQEREDLEQEIKIKILEKIDMLMEQEAPDFLDLAIKIEKQDKKRNY